MNTGEKRSILDNPEFYINGEYITYLCNKVESPFGKYDEKSGTVYCGIPSHKKCFYRNDDKTCLNLDRKKASMLIDLERQDLKKRKKMIENLVK